MAVEPADGFGFDAVTQAVRTALRQYLWPLAPIVGWYLLLGTADAYTLYSRYGFGQTERFMSRLDGSDGEQVAECA